LGALKSQGFDASQFLRHDPASSHSGESSCVVTQVPSGGLTLVEQSLVEHVGRGEWLDLAADNEAVDEAAMRSWDDSGPVGRP